jgi:nicotinate-nucleotide adenylyltransferase
MGKLKNAIGIFGGSFDPPHRGHLKIAKICLNKFNFKKIYWIVSKKNPFKKKPLFSLKTRIEKSKNLVKKLKKVKVVYIDGKIKS